MIRTLVVTLDGSELADGALPVAAAIARLSGARIVCVGVHRPVTLRLGRSMLAETLDARGDLDREDRETLAAHLARRAAELRERDGLAAEPLMLDGPAPVQEQLVAWLEAGDVDLVVMTSHGRGAVGRFLLGSVAEHLIRMSGRPCLLVRGVPLGGAAEAGGFRRIVVPVDGSPASEGGIAQAVALADPAGAELHLLEVVVPLPWLSPTMVPEATYWGDPTLNNRTAEAQRYLAQLAARVSGSGPNLRVQTSAPLHPNPAVAILDLLDAEQADLVVLAAAQRSGADRLLLGSVMDKIVRHATIPTLVARTAPQPVAWAT